MRGRCGPVPRRSRTRLTVLLTVRGLERVTSVLALISCSWLTSRSAWRTSVVRTTNWRCERWIGWLPTQAWWPDRSSRRSPETRTSSVGSEDAVATPAGPDHHTPPAAHTVRETLECFDRVFRIANDRYVDARAVMANPCQTSRSAMPRHPTRSKSSNSSRGVWRCATDRSSWSSRSARKARIIPSIALAMVTMG